MPTPLIKQLTEAAMKAELDARLAASDEPGRKNGSTPWPTLTTSFKYPDYVQKVIYTINAVEAVHRQFRKLARTGVVSPTKTACSSCSVLVSYGQLSAGRIRC